MEDYRIKGGKENIIPDAAGLFYALRNMGYENTAAVADLIDNSIDANATNVWVAIDEDLNRIFIADDGTGMSEDALHTAIILGGKKVHDTNSDLGKYGVGLITASFSMGKVIRIITKQDGVYNTVTLDYEEIRRTNMFKADFHLATGTEKMSFDYRTNNADSGTVLIIDNCDKIQYKNLKSFENDLEKKIGEVFRSFIEKGKRIYINGKKIDSEEVFYLNHEGTKILIDEDIEIEKNDGTSGKLHVMAVKINDFGAGLNKKLHINIQRQGFYILRNGREIAAALEFPEIYIKHNSLNLLRIELSFNPDLDDEMGINLKKHDIAPSQEIINSLKRLLEEAIKKLRAEITAKQKAKNNPFVSPVPVTAPQPTPESSPGASSTQQTLLPGLETPLSKQQPKSNEYEFNFLTYAGKEDEPLFKASNYDNKISIRYNVKNIFYSNNIINSDDGATTKKMIDKIIESSVRAFLKTSNEKDLSKFFEQVKEELNKTN